jgi:competence protein ComEC
MVLPMAAGVGLEIFADHVLTFPFELLVVMCGVLTIAISISLIFMLPLKPSFLYSRRVANGFFITLMPIAIGYLLAWFFVQKNLSNHFSKHVYSESFLVARLDQPVLQKENIASCVAEVFYVVNGTIKISTTGKLLINFKKDDASRIMSYGDVITFKARIEEFQEPQNPEEFSFKLYQSFHNVFNRTFLQSGSWRIVDAEKGNRFLSRVYSIREYFLGVIESHIKSKNELGVASAIMLGYRDYMNGDIVQAYSSSGALHVLSVSGLHVGIVYMMLSYLLMWMENRGRWLKIAQVLILILTIWAYAFITGLSPSVLRAATMFSLLASGKLFFRNVNTYNIIAASALVLMLFNPFIVTEVGFRLSYLAVIGIIFLQPKIYNRLVFKNWLLDKAWMIVAVSIAAQIATFPLSLYYFHQFPNFFLASNLVIIPASNLILFVGMGLLFFAEVPHVHTVLGGAFQYLIKGVNEFVFWIGNLPYSLVQGISITMVEMLLMYLLIFLLCWLSVERKTKVVVLSLVIILILCGYNSYESVAQMRQKMLVVYAARQHSAVAVIEKKKVCTIFDEKLLQNESAMLFHVKHHWWSCGVNETEPEQKIGQFDFGKIYLVGNTRIAVVDSTMELKEICFKEKLKVDYLIVSHNPKLRINKLMQIFDCETVIFDSSNKPGRTKYWKQEFAKQGITPWDVSEQGAYIVEL